MIAAPKAPEAGRKVAVPQAAYVTNADRQPDNAFKTISKEIGRHLRKREQRDSQYDTHHA